MLTCAYIKSRTECAVSLNIYFFIDPVYILNSASVINHSCGIFERMMQCLSSSTNNGLKRSTSILFLAVYSPGITTLRINNYFVNHRRLRWAAGPAFQLRSKLLKISWKRSLCVVLSRRWEIHCNRPKSVTCVVHEKGRHGYLSNAVFSVTNLFSKRIFTICGQNIFTFCKCVKVLTNPCWFCTILYF